MKSIKIFLIISRTFGFKVKYLFIFALRVVVTALSNVGFFIDDVIYRKYKKVVIKKPVFLIGHPRSGTTFVHRFIDNNIKDLRTIYMWEMIFPSIFFRKLISGFKNQLMSISLDKVWEPKIHKTGFGDAETEDIALFVRYFEGFLSWLYFILWNRFQNEEEFYQELEENCNQDKFISYLEKLHRKNIYMTNGRMFSKSFALVFNFESIKTKFPDSKILIMIRNPIEAIASFMSLEQRAQTKINGFDKLSKEEQQRYLDGIYKTSYAYYVKALEVHTKYNDGSVIFITHKQLLKDFEGSMKNILNHYEIDIDEEINLAIEEQARRQKEFSSEHKYNLEQFGYNKEKILEDFKFVYENFDV